MKNTFLLLSALIFFSTSFALAADEHPPLNKSGSTFGSTQLSKTSADGRGPAQAKGAVVDGKSSSISSEAQGKKRGKEKLSKEASGEGKVGEGPEEPSQVERALTEASIAPDKSNVTPQKFTLDRLTQFGYSFFNSEQEESSADSDIPVGPEYILGSGDRIVLTLWGSIDGTFELEVNRSGEIVLPKVGTVKVAGQTFEKLPLLLKAHISRFFKDFNLNVNMGKLRLIKVYVVGEVEAPGDYTLTSLSTLLNALSAAGGPTKNGSLRNIKINRNGKIVQNVDLYDFFLHGNRATDVRLQPGDTIVVPVIGPVAGIAGNVRRPAIYELHGERTLKDLLSLAGGVNATGYLQRVQLYRVEAHEKKVACDFNLDSKGGKTIDEVAATIPIRDMDLVEIFPIDVTLRDYVRLEGYVLRPGDYALRPGMRVSDLLTKDILLPEYYPFAGRITRLFPPDYHAEVIFFDVSQALKGDASANLELKEFDKVKIFSRMEMEEPPVVQINGEVQKPGPYRYFTNMTVRDLVLQAGNVKQSAFEKNAEISRVKRTGESIKSFSVTVNLGDALKGDPASNLVLQQGDVLSIRRIPNWAEETERYIALKGEFLFPGNYLVYKGERLSSVIERAGGFTDKAFLPGAKFTRVKLRELQQKRMDEILARTEMDLAKKESELASTTFSQESQEATKVSLEGLKKTVELLKQAKAEGRLVIKLAAPKEFKDGAYDLEVQGGDVLDVPADPQTVSIFGQVYNPASYVFLPGDKVASYLKKAGGPTQQADEGDMYVIKADGSVESRHSSPGFLGIGGFLSHHADSGDTVVVPQRLEKIAWLRELKDITTILGQLALTAGVLIAAGL